MQCRICGLETGHHKYKKKSGNVCYPCALSIKRKESTRWRQRKKEGISGERTAKGMKYVNGQIVYVQPKTKILINRVSRAQLINSIKDNGSCAICKESESCCLHFHHIDGTNKKFELGKPVGKTIEEVRDEVAKCILVCANCHAKIHSGKLSISPDPLNFEVPYPSIK